MTRHLRRKRIQAQRAADSAWRRVQRFRQGGLGRHLAGGDLLEKGVNALLVRADFGGWWHSGGRALLDGIEEDLNLKILIDFFKKKEIMCRLL